MDRREEETEDGEIQSNLGKFLELFPLDLTPDLLLRLPAKSAVRFRGVSKLWSSRFHQVVCHLVFNSAVSSCQLYNKGQASLFHLLVPTRASGSGHMLFSRGPFSDTVPRSGLFPTDLQICPRLDLLRKSLVCGPCGSLESYHETRCSLTGP